MGTLSDQTGAVVPKATVIMVNRDTGQTRQAITDEAGRYSLTNVLPGSYNLSVTAPGFKPLTQTNVAVVINTVTRTDLSLEVGAMAESVTVIAEATPLQSEKTDVHVDLSTKAVEDMPLPRYRNFQTLIDLVPGATPGQFQNAITDTPARALSTNINGANRNNNNTRVDGSTSVFIWLPHHTAYVPPAETIETVNISTNNFDAEQGMAGGAAITVATKSGTNNFHGSVFALHDNQHLQARSFFIPTKPKSIRNIDGGTLGGPIKRNKLFFFAGWERNRERLGVSKRFSVPTAPMRRGDFSSFPTTIYDPLTGNRDGSGRKPFPNNIIPPDQISPITKKLVDLTPLPNLSGLFSNFVNSATSVLDRDNIDAKVNWNRSDRHSVWGKYSVMDASAVGKFGLGAAGGECLCPGGNGTGHTLVQVATIGHTWTAKPNFLVDGTLGFTRMGQNVMGPDFGTNFGLEVLGIPGTNGPDPRQSGMPIFEISTFSSLGNVNNWSPIFRNDQSFTFTQNAAWVRGGHELRFGFDAIHHLLNHWQPEVGAGPRGKFTFTGGVTALKGGPSPDRFNSYAAFLLGLPASLGKSVQFIKLNGQEWQLAGYFRDRWHVTPKLTFNLGLRYEYYPLLTRAQGGIERYDPTSNLLFLGGRGNVPRNVGITTSKKLFAPRVGVAYRATSSTVIRTGYGITYNPMPLSRPLRGFYPYTIASDFSGPNNFTSFGPIANGIPEICCPDITSGAVLLPTSALTRTPFLGPLKRGYIQSWNFIIEQKLPGDFVASLGYVGTRTVHSFATLNVNAAPPGTGNGGRPQFATFGRIANSFLFQGFLDANYHSLQATIHRRFSRGLLIKGAYTYSKAINQTDDDGTDNISWNIPSQFSRNRAQAGYNIPHIFHLGYVYELPLGKGQRFANTSRLAQAVLGGWQVNGIFSAYQGRPFTVTASDASLSAPGNLQTADQIKPNVTKLGGIFDTPYFDPTAFAPVTEARFGTSGRNILRGPGVVNMDVSLFRDLQLTERLKLQFRAEAFNVSNTPHFGLPKNNASDRTNFFRITSTDEDNTPARQFRFGLRLNF